MKINPNNFSTTRENNAIITPGSESEGTNSGGDFAFIAYPLNLDPISLLQLTQIILCQLK